MLIRLGAALIRDSEDILELLGLRTAGHDILINTDDLNEEEMTIISLLSEPKERDVLVRESKLETHRATATMSLLEIKGLIVEELGLVRKTF